MTDTAGTDPAPESRPFWTRLWARCLGGLVVGAISAAGFGQTMVPLLLLVGVAGLTLLTRGLSGPRGALVGFVSGLGYFGVLLSWATVVGNDGWVLLAAACATFYALLGAGSALVQRLPWWPLWIACSWVFIDLFRENFPLDGFPWGRLADADVEPFRRFAVMGGFPLVTFTIALCGALVAWAVVEGGRAHWRNAAISAGLTVGLVLVGVVVPLPSADSSRTMTIAVVQGGVPGTGLDFSGRARAVTENHVVETLKLAEAIKAKQVPQPDLVVWPENSTDVDPRTNRQVNFDISEAAKAVGAPILLGAVLDSPDGTKALNAAILWDPVTGVGDTYIKQHPVPFGEYVPFRSLLGDRVSRLARIPRDFDRGDKPGLMQVGDVTLGLAICFEVADDEVFRDDINGGAEVFVVLTNNATYAQSNQPEQQFAITRGRALEHGRWAVVAATTGISGFVDSQGSVDQALAQNQAGFAVQDVPLRNTTTPAHRISQPLQILVSMVAVGAFVLAVIQARRRRRTVDALDHRETEPA